MAYYAFIGVDGPDGSAIRKQVRELHRAHIRKNHTDCIFVSGGPLLDPLTNEMCGSLLVFEARSIGDVERVLNEDPYTLNALYQSRMIYPFNWTFGRPQEEALA
jgi:uncharacterized protein YciI